MLELLIWLVLEFAEETLTHFSKKGWMFFVMAKGAKFNGHDDWINGKKKCHASLH